MTRSPGWDRPLPKPLPAAGNVTIATLAEARAYINAVGDRAWQIQYWKEAAELIHAAAEHDGSIAAAATQLELALFLDGKLGLL